MNDMEKYIASLPPPSVNNSREYVRRRWARYQETKSPLIGRELEEITGIPYDEKDYGADQNVEKY